jgi:hypothetical protein
MGSNDPNLLGIFHVQWMGSLSSISIILDILIHKMPIPKAIVLHNIYANFISFN